MQQINGWEKVKAAQDFIPLPAGGYIVDIKKAEVKAYPTRDGGNIEKFEIIIDIAEGDFTKFYENDYKSQTSEDKKWKGVLRLYMPKDDGSEKDEWTKSRFKATTEAIEDSNPGYHWDWNEAALKGKKVGCLFRNEEWDYNGKHGWKAQPFKFISVDKIRSGKFTVPKDKPLAVGSSTSTSPANTNASIDDEDLPF